MITVILITLLTWFLHKPDTGATLLKHWKQAANYSREYAMNPHLCVLVNYGYPWGKNRLAVWDFDKEEVVYTCPVAHGKGHKFSRKPKFSNEEESWLSSLGKCRIAERYEGRFGTSYRLDGLEESNSNMRKRCVVMHSYWTVPTKAVFPLPIGRSKGCVMVSKKSMEVLDNLLKDQKDVLLYIYNELEFKK